MNSTQTDRIEKKIILKAPRSRVWSALTDSKQFGEWFGCDIEGPFVPGATIHGITTHPDFKGFHLELVIQRVEPESLFSYLWHPATSDTRVDYSSEAMTTVEFHLAEVAGGTELTVIESGFDQVPLARQATAYRRNDEGWSFQIKSIEKYVGG